MAVPLGPRLRLSAQLAISSSPGQHMTPWAACESATTIVATTRTITNTAILLLQKSAPVASSSTSRRSQPLCLTPPRIIVGLPQQWTNASRTQTYSSVTTAELHQSATLIMLLPFGLTRGLTAALGALAATAKTPLRQLSFVSELFVLLDSSA